MCPRVTRMLSGCCKNHHLRELEEKRNEIFEKLKSNSEESD